MFRTRLSLVASLISAIFFISLLPNNPASASMPEFSKCLLPAAQGQHMSLGSPLAPERLANKTKIRVGVLPFYFNNSDTKQLSDFEKGNYLQAAKSLEKLSNGIISVEIVFLESIKFDKSSDSIRQAYMERGLPASELLDVKGTWGLVRQVIAAADPVRDFSNLDSVILESNNKNGYSIAEAMQFVSNLQGNPLPPAELKFYKPISTQEGVINNAILLDTHKGEGTIVHELLHNFGLVDLYGSGTGPVILSIMDIGSQRLLNYEKAVLGWFPPENFNCKNFNESLNNSTVENVLEISNNTMNSIMLLKKTEDSAYIFEIINNGNESQLAVYFLEQNRRPPITVSYDPKTSFVRFIDIKNPKSIGSFYRTNEFDVLITNINANTVTLNLIPRKLIQSPEALLLAQKSLANRDIAVANERALAEAKVKADIEAKVKSEAEAKAKAEGALTVKKSTIYCIKGKTTLKVAALKPKCPTGYKLKK